jgi:DNA-binding HxlR family transcriptional regulator
MGTGKLCPLAASARILGARWTLEILYNLRKPLRFCEIQDSLAGVNPRTLSQRLKFLEGEGLIERLPLSDSSAYQKYQLTDMGRDLLPVLESLQGWSAKWIIDRIEG